MDIDLPAFNLMIPSFLPLGSLLILIGIRDIMTSHEDWVLIAA